MDSDSNQWLITVSLGETFAEVEKRLILSTLERLGGNRTQTANALGLSIRTIRNKLRQYRSEAQSGQ